MYDYMLCYIHTGLFGYDAASHDQDDDEDTIKIIRSSKNKKAGK